MTEPRTGRTFMRFDLIETDSQGNLTERVENGLALRLADIESFGPIPNFQGLCWIKTESEEVFRVGHSFGYIQKALEGKLGIEMEKVPTKKNVVDMRQQEVVDNQPTGI